MHRTKLHVVPSRVSFSSRIDARNAFATVGFTRDLTPTTAQGKRQQRVEESQRNDNRPFTTTNTYTQKHGFTSFQAGGHYTMGTSSADVTFSGVTRELSPYVHIHEVSSTCKTGPQCQVTFKDSQQRGEPSSRPTREKGTPLMPQGLHAYPSR